MQPAAQWVISSPTAHHHVFHVPLDFTVLEPSTCLHRAPQELLRVPRSSLTQARASHALLARMLQQELLHAFRAALETTVFQARAAAPRALRVKLFQLRKIAVIAALPAHMQTLLEMFA